MLNFIIIYTILIAIEQLFGTFKKNYRNFRRKF